jgi:hypothetical protein
MDARRLLGVGTDATPADIERARRRLRRQVGPEAGGTVELARAITMAARELLTGPVAEARLDPHELLGIRPGATPGEARLAYRRLARLVHPDRGGTEELFSLVEAAYQAVSRPRAGYHNTFAESVWDPYHVRRRPPPPRYSRPRSPKPWVAPPPERWSRPSRWQALLTVAVNATIVALVLVPALGLAALFVAAAGLLAVPPALGLIAGSYLLFRRVARMVLFGLAQLRPSRLLPGSEPERFLAECCFDSPTDRVAEDRLYEAYRDWCRRNSLTPAASWVFAQRLLTLGILRTDAAGWEEALWVGLRLRPRLASA